MKIESHFLFKTCMKRHHTEIYSSCRTYSTINIVDILVIGSSGFETKSKRTFGVKAKIDGKNWRLIENKKNALL